MTRLEKERHNQLFDFRTAKPGDRKVAIGPTLDPYYRPLLRMRR